MLPERDVSAHGTAAAALRLLYVEDNRLNAILFSEALRLRGGFELRLAVDADDALTQLAGWQPDVLVLDAQLPGLDGFELLARLRVQPHLAAVPAFMCSADGLSADIERARLAGFIGYWPKPINLAAILEDLRQVAQAVAAR